jgi:hypothetical protein
MEQAVFRCVGDVAAVLWVVRTTDDALYVTDDKGITELGQGGQSDRIVGMAKERAYRYDPSQVTHGDIADWSRLSPFSGN